MKKIDAQMTEAAAIAALALDSKQEPRTIEVNGKQGLVIPEGWRAEVPADKEVLAAPRRAAGNIVVADVDSLVRELGRWPGAPTVVQVNRVKRTMGAVLNPHTPESPGWGDHTVSLQVKLSRDLDRWLCANRRPMSHAEFADFMEEAQGIVAPARGEVLEMVAEFRVAETGGGSSHFDAKTGQYAVRWEGAQKHETELPRLTVRVPAFEEEDGELMVTLGVRIRPQVKDKVLSFSLLIDGDVEDELSRAWDDLVGDSLCQHERLPEGVAERVINVA